jgi:hypothetical protein
MEQVMRRFGRCVAAASLLGLFGCEAMPAPKGYVRVDPPPAYAYRAVSADGAVLSVRTVDNPREGTLEFWGKAITNELVASRGYKLEARQDVTSDRGRPGLEMTMRTQIEGIEYVYLLTVFVKSNQVMVFEATGPVKSIEPDLDAIRRAIRVSSLL